MSYPYQTNPTIVPAADFNPRADAEALRKAMKGLGTDEKAIIQVLAKKSNMQRQEIANQFKALYGKDLIKDLKGELSGRFEDLVLACVTPLPQFYAKELHDAMSGVGTDEACLVEILATSSNHYINVIRSTYKAMYGKDLERELGGETSGHFRRLLVSLCQGRRDENPVVNPGICAEDARALLQAGEKKWGTDESTFNAILATRSFPHLHQLMVDYERLSGHSLEKAIKKEFSGDIEDGLLAIAIQNTMAIGWNVNPPPPHLADALQRSGTPNPTTGYPMPPQRTTNNPMPPHSSSQSSHSNTTRMGQYRNSSRPSNNPTHWFCFTLCWMIIW